MPSVLVVGAGAIGGLLASRLAPTCVDVAVVVGESEHSKAVLEKQGVTVVTPSGGQFRAFAAFGNVADIPHSFLADLNVVVLATKGRDGDIGGLNVVTEVVKRASENIVIVPLLNTVDAYECLVQKLPNAIVLAGLARLSTFVVQPGVVEVAVGLELLRLQIGPANRGMPDEIVEGTCDLLQCEGVSVTQVEDGLAALWAKCVLATAAGVVAAACEVTCYEAAKYERTRRLSLDVVREMCAVAKAHGVDVTYMTKRPESVLKMFKPGMLWSIQRDIMMDKPSELEVQLGTYVRRAERLEVAVPTLSTMYALLLPRTAAASSGEEIVWPSDIEAVLPGSSNKKTSSR